jgi:hypothetical protein
MQSLFHHHQLTLTQSPSPAYTITTTQLHSHCHTHTITTLLHLHNHHLLLTLMYPRHQAPLHTMSITHSHLCKCTIATPPSCHPTSLLIHLHPLNHSYATTIAQIPSQPTPLHSCIIRTRCNHTTAPTCPHPCPCTIIITPLNCRHHITITQSPSQNHHHISAPTSHTYTPTPTQPPLCSHPHMITVAFTIMITHAITQMQLHLDDCHCTIPITQSPPPHCEQYCIIPAQHTPICHHCVMTTQPSLSYNPHPTIAGTSTFLNHHHSTTTTQHNHHHTNMPALAQSHQCNHPRTTTVAQLPLHH